MDLISHGLIGSMVAGLGINKKFGIISSVAMILGNLAPDFDGIMALKGPKAFYKYHREFTHSLIGSASLTVLVSLGIYLATPFKHFLLLLAIVGAGVATHLLMDSFTPWGLPLFYPFSNKKYSFNLIWFIDPAIIGSLVAALIISWQYEVYTSLANLLAFGVIAAYLTLRVVQRKRARALVCSDIPRGYRGAKVWVLPSAISPFIWDVILNSRGKYMYVCVDSRRGKILRTKEYASAAYHKCVSCSQESELVEVFLKRSTFPFYSIIKDEGTYVVEWFDVHLMQLGGVHGVRVAVDNETGVILEEKLKVRKPVRRRKQPLQEMSA